MEYRLSDDWQNILEIVIFGYGRIAKDNIDYFINNFKVINIIDSDITKCGQVYRDIEILHVEKAYEQMKRYKTIIMTVERNAFQISKILKKMGLKENVQYCSLERFITEWFWRFKQKACLMEVHTSITTRCTFKCMNCNMFMPYYKQHTDYTVEYIDRDLEQLFRNVDYVFKYMLLGGEPLLNRNLPDILEMICEKYKGKIGNVGIVTNGSVFPEQRLLEVSEKNNITYSISDYTAEVDYKSRIQSVEKQLEKYNIQYAVNKNLRWCDFGFPERECGFEITDVRNHMLECAPVFHGLNDEKLYYCHVAWSAEKCGLFINRENDYIRLSELTESKESKQKILEHCRGMVEGGFISLCAKCGGCGNDNPILVRAAKQIGR